MKTNRHTTIVRTVVVAVGIAIASLVAAVAPASAATNTWYKIPAAQGATASVNMTWFNKSYGSGSGGGQIWLNATQSGTYVQFKPNEGGTWNRGTSNRSSGAAYYNWSDNFTLNYSGFMFRICKDRVGPDACGSSVKVYG